MISFEWDQQKAAENLRKHGVSFEEASSAFRDALSHAVPDPDHAPGEGRLVLMGESQASRLLVVSFRETRDIIRLISAREATRAERKRYEEA